MNTGRMKQISIKGALAVIFVVAAIFAYLAFLAAGHKQEAEIAVVLEDDSCYLVDHPDNTQRQKSILIRMNGVPTLATFFLCDTDKINRPWSCVWTPGCESLLITDRATITLPQLERMLPRLRWLKRISIHDQHELSQNIEQFQKMFPNIEFKTDTLICDPADFSFMAEN